MKTKILAALLVAIALGAPGLVPSAEPVAAASRNVAAVPGAGSRSGLRLAGAEDSVAGCRRQCRLDLASCLGSQTPPDTCRKRNDQCESKCF